MANPTKKTMAYDGNQAAAHAAYMFSEVAVIYPVTPSSMMAGYVDEWAAAKRKSIFGEIVEVQEMQSEAGAAGATHGALQAGALGVTFTASQDLLLVLPSMYKVAGELLPGVCYVAARTIASQALSIFGGHRDVMSACMTDLAQLCTGSVQEVVDLAAIAHLIAIKNRVFFIHFFDGLRTSHEIQKIEYLFNRGLEPLIDQKVPRRFREHTLSAHAPVVRGTVQSGDIFFQTRETSNPFCDAVPVIAQDYMDQLAKIIGRHYHPFDHHGDPEAEHVVIAMGSATEAIRGSIDYLHAQGKKVGLIVVHLYHPFSVEHFLDALPKSVKHIAVLDRAKEPGATGDPLYLDVKNTLYTQPNAPLVVGGRYGLSSKGTTPVQIIAILDNLAMNEPKDRSIVDIVDDVTFKSLPLGGEVELESNAYETKSFGLGADGTVGANENSVKIISEGTDKYRQAYFTYDSKKSGGSTASHLRFGDQLIRGTCLVVCPSSAACHVPAYLRIYNVLAGFRKGDTFLLNFVRDLGSIEEHLSNHIKHCLAGNKISFYMTNAVEITQRIGLGDRTSTILQSAFFRIPGVIPYDLAVERMEKFIAKSYSRKGEETVNKNFAAIDEGANAVQVPIRAEWASLPNEPAAGHAGDTDLVRNVVHVTNAQHGDSLPASAFMGRESGTWDSGTVNSEKRGVSDLIPVWVEGNCIQYSQCAFIRPHATIRPFLLNEKEAQGTNVALLDAMGKDFKETGLKFRIQANYLDCLGCSNCANTYPGNKRGKAFKMTHLDETHGKRYDWGYMRHQVTNESYVVDVQSNVRSSQFVQPLFEYSGACSGCDETSYVKLLAQLSGTRRAAANATGCSFIYSASTPSMPYTTNDRGEGPVWANSLFRDNAKFGTSMYITSSSSHNHLVHLVKEVLKGGQEQLSDELHQFLSEWAEQRLDDDALQQLSYKTLSLLNAEAQSRTHYIYNLRHHLVKPSQWIIGGDGWTYDIGLSGLDHVLAPGKSINILVLDTEVYSNAGGQSSRSTPLGAIAKFAAVGKRVRKKDLGLIAITYGYVYVAQIAIGVNPTQTLRALRKAKAYEGPSLVIAYLPCTSYGLKGGTGSAQNEQKCTVKCGYRHLWYHDPRREQEGKNPFVLDSKEPDLTKFKDFLRDEVRYASLFRICPGIAEELANESLRSAYKRYSTYVCTSSTEWENGYGPLTDIPDTESGPTTPEEVHAVGLT